MTSSQAEGEIETHKRGSNAKLTEDDIQEIRLCFSVKKILVVAP